MPPGAGRRRRRWSARPPARRPRPARARRAGCGWSAALGRAQAEPGQVGQRLPRPAPSGGSGSWTPRRRSSSRTEWRASADQGASSSRRSAASPADRARLEGEQRPAVQLPDPEGDPGRGQGAVAGVDVDVADPLGRAAAGRTGRRPPGRPPAPHLLLVVGADQQDPLRPRGVARSCGGLLGRGQLDPDVEPVCIRTLTVPEGGHPPGRGQVGLGGPDRVQPRPRAGDLPPGPRGCAGAAWPGSWPGGRPR